MSGRREKRGPADARPTGVELDEGEEGAVQIGATDQGMVRLIVSTRAGVFELDFAPDEAEDIAHELAAAADRARRTAG